MYPGDEAVRDQTDVACSRLVLRTYAPHAYADPNVEPLAYSPNERAWNWDVESHHIVRVAYTTDRERKMSLRS